MIAVDSNVLVRLLVRDDEPQVDRVLRLLQGAADKGELCLITAPVLCELVWVLTGAYGVVRRDVIAALKALLDDPAFEIDGREAVSAAVERYGSGRGDFADYLIAAQARRRGVATTYTFDRGLRREPDFALL
jgi:predicted nucleic-acid-binding protein